MNYLNITYPDVENGLGFRVTLWLSGCKLNCKGCQNPKSHSFTAGKPITEDTVEELIAALDKSYIKGLTLSGGNPLDSNPDELCWLLSKIKTRLPEKDIWLYSGYELNEILGTEKEKVLNLVDVLVDGRFMLELKDTSLAFRGSKNQIIWVKDKTGKFIKYQ
jgi:anaerobic ribonucleoside-triphosphate reductase activating protein